MLACTAPSAQPVTGKSGPLFVTPAQMDSLCSRDSQAVSQSLWNVIRPGQDSARPAWLYRLSGNLDQDEQSEIILWYRTGRYDDAGSALWFDRNGENWQLVGEVFLDFLHGENPPRIDSALQALVVYSYGWGSGFGSVCLNFYRYKDSITEVLSMIENEGLSMMGSGAFRHISGTYQRLSDSSLVVSYVYQVICNDEGKHQNDLVFSEKITIPYFWNSAAGSFEARPPAGLSASDFGPYWDGESTLDPYFGPKLDKIRNEGPKWKQACLGRWVDE